MIMESYLIVATFYLLVKKILVISDCQAIVSSAIFLLPSGEMESSSNTISRLINWLILLLFLFDLSNSGSLCVCVSWHFANIATKSISLFKKAFV